MRLLSFIFFIVGLLATGVLGTETRLLFFWPGCLLLGVAGLIAGTRWKMRIHFSPSDACLASMLVLVLYLVGRACWQPVEVYAREDGVIFLACFVTYLLTCTVASHPRWRVAILWTLVLLVVSNLAVGFIHFSGNWSFHIVPEFARTFGAEGQRIGGFFVNSNHLAAFLSLVVFLCAGVLCFGRGGASSKLVLGFICICACIGMALTQSRGALVGLVGGVLVLGSVGFWILWQTQRHIFGRLALGISVVLLLGGSVLFLVNSEFQKRRASVNPLTNDVRLHIWKAALGQHAMNPAFGMGPRMFYDYGNTLRPAEMPVHQQEPQFAHNEYLQLLADYGWVGLGLAALMVVLHVAHGLRFLGWYVAHKYPHSGTLMSDTAGFTVGAMAALAATLTHAVFEFHLHVPATAVLTALVLGLLANPGFDLSQQPPLSLPSIRLVSKGLLVVCSLAMISTAVWFGPAEWLGDKSQLAARRQDMQERMECLDTAAKRDPRNPHLLYLRAMAHLDQWKPSLPKSVQDRILERAALDLKAASHLNPQHYLYTTLLTDVSDRLGREEEALKAAQQAVRSAPQHEEARLALALHLHRWQHFAEAEKAYLWASSASLRNQPGEFGWGDGYQQLLKDAAVRRMAQR